MTELDTKLCRTLDLEYPIVQESIESSPGLAAAVSNAGGLGMLSLTRDIHCSNPMGGYGHR